MPSFVDWLVAVGPNSTGKEAPSISVGPKAPNQIILPIDDLVLVAIHPAKEATARCHDRINRESFLLRSPVLKRLGGANKRVSESLAVRIGGHFRPFAKSRSHIREMNADDLSARKHIRRR